MADTYITNKVKISYKYFISRNIINKADKINPIPTLNKSKQRIGYNKNKNFQEKEIPSNRQNPNKTNKLIPKLIKEATFLDSKNRYFGIFTFEKILAL